MDWLHTLLDFILHLDHYLNAMIIDYGTWIYAILFLIIFIETGLVVMPFLPGDSLLFAAGSFCALGSMDLMTVLGLLTCAAVLGDASNYFLGKKVGLRMLQWKFRGKQFVKQKYIDQTHEFYEKHGSKTIIIARFVPIVRTFAPFVAGIGEMSYKKFFRFNLIGGVVWVLGLTLLGYFFGTLPFVQKNFEWVIFGIIGLSVLPMLVEIIRIKMKKE